MGGGLAGFSPAAAATSTDLAATGPLGDVLINELANGGQRSDADGFVELRNWGDEPVDLSGWHLFRCSVMGLRSNVGRPEGDLSGIVLAPGAIVTISKVGMPGERHITEPFALGGFGLYLEGPGGVLADRVGVYPNDPWPTQSECTPPSGNLTNSLNFSINESWQRVADTGDVTRDFVVAPATIDSANAASAEVRAASPVVISELTGAGPHGAADDFIELRNDGTTTVDLGGWTLDRCTPSGRLRTDTRQLTIAVGTRLAPGDTWVAAGPGFDGDADASYPVHLGDVEFGALLRDDDGEVVSRVAVSSYGDSACQGDDTKLNAVLDPVAAESWQLTAAGDWVIAPRTPGAANASREASVYAERLQYPAQPGVAISELATDPSPEGMPDGTVQRNFIELGNYGTEPVDIAGWSVRRCLADGTRALKVQFTVANGTVLEPGAVYLAAREGTAAASDADATYGTSFNFLGTGVWLADATGERVDSVGVYEVNEMDASTVTESACTKGVALATYLPDRLIAETFQRSQFTGVDADDFTTAPATPGELDLVPWVDPTERVTGAQGPGTAADSGAGLETRPTEPSAPRPASVLAAFSGVSAAPLATEVGENETQAETAEDDGYGFPYQRFVLDASDLTTGSLVRWSGTTLERQELQFSVWTGNAWRLIDAASGDGDGGVTLQGALVDGDIREGKVTLLVQDGPRTVATMTSTPDSLLENPASYDLAISHITDTQYLSESYPEVYAQLVSWIADSAPERKIAFATHTGDLIQNWVDPDQNDERALREFARASAIQGILDDAGVPNSVLPGNHDNKRGVDDSLFNEFFPPSRYEAEPWYGGSIAPDDNSANYSTFEQAGAKFLMLSLPYAYGERELVWAEQVVAAHPDFNVVISTHEHVTPKTTEQGAGHSTGSRWVSRGQQLWDRVIAPNRNVVMVLSGHFHGLGQITTDDAGGIAGHTVVELLADYQEFRTHTGERATGFQRLLQLDLASGSIAVDTFSVRLSATASFPYDYEQFLPDNGLPTTPSNGQPWRIVADGTQDRYDVSDDEFGAHVAFQYEKVVTTSAVTVGDPAPVAGSAQTRRAPEHRGMV